MKTSDFGICSSAKYKQARDVGERIVTLTKEGVRFSDIVTEAVVRFTYEGIPLYDDEVGLSDGTSSATMGKMDGENPHSVISRFESL